MRRWLQVAKTRLTRKFQKWLSLGLLMYAPPQAKILSLTWFSRWVCVRTRVLLFSAEHCLSGSNVSYFWCPLGKRRYSIKLWKTFTDCFNCLPVAAIVDEKIFCCHGGLSPDLTSMEQIRRILRPTDVPDTGKSCRSYQDLSLATFSLAIFIWLRFNKFWSYFRVAVWYFVGWPWQGGSRIVGKWPRSQFHVRCWHCEQIPPAPRHGPDMSRSPGRGRWLRIFRAAAACHFVLRSQLLRWIRQRRWYDVCGRKSHVLLPGESVFSINFMRSIKLVRFFVCVTSYMSPLIQQAQLNE